MIFMIFWIAGLIFGIITAIFTPSCRDISSVANNLLQYQLVVTVFPSGLTGFLGHVFASDKIARQIGWPAGSPFQKELGFAELGYAIAGFLCIWYPPMFKLAVIITFTPLFIGAAFLHSQELREKGNINPGNVMSILPDFLIPVTLIILSLSANLWRIPR